MHLLSPVRRVVYQHVSINSNKPCHFLTLEKKLGVKRTDKRAFG